ncbi:hypothetical protein [Edaphobacter dinghuensis]|uniref:Uncharacterized protein n=1 Tax=Edaphobacter dinghuensis TaxID=1560005 RepID=A0A917H9J8_9BACT|nr:hypothetical protein [Edaphobacter dinghuensis]GGG71985.1 hypothetical protein GCM10011585_12810 [Edaphobacter dinghuensis]
MNQIGRHTGKRKQWNRAVEALLLTTTSRDAAKAAGISETTLYRYLNDGSFRAMYNEAKRRMLDGTINKLRLASSGAVDVLEAIAHDPASPQSARVAAAKTLLEMAVRCGAIEEIEQRLLELEASNAKVIEGVRSEQDGLATPDSEVGESNWRGREVDNAGWNGAHDAATDNV